MRQLITYFIKYPIAGNTLLVLILIFGIFGQRNLRKTFFPESESKFIIVSAVYPGASPSEIEEGIILKMEDNLDGVAGIDRITSTSKENLGTVTVEVGIDYKTEIVLQDVKNAIDRISSFPAGMEPPSVFIQENRSLAMTFALSGDLSISDLKQIGRQVENDFKAMEGISRVELSGFPNEEIEIRVSDEQLQKYQLSIEQIALAVRAFNLELTGGNIETRSEKILIRSYNKHYSALDLNNVVVKHLPSGQTIKLSDVAEVVEAWEDLPYERYFRGQKAVVVTLNHTIHEDIVHVTTEAKKYIEDFNEKHSVVQAHIIQDQSKTVVDRINLLSKNGIIGFFLVLIFLSLFLHPYTSFWVALSIPIAFGGMFVLANFFGISINVISLFGMIIVIGILVDDGIVIAENIYQHVEKGKSPIQAAIDGTMEVFPAVTSAVLTTMVAFSTFFFLDGRMGSFFPEMGFVVIATLLFSLVEGAFILPAHIAHSRAMKKSQKSNFITKSLDFFTVVLDWLKLKIYAPILKFAIKKPIVIVVLSIATFATTITAIQSGLIKLTIFPNLESDYINVSLKMPPGTNKEITEQWIDHVQNAVFELNNELLAEYDSIDVVQGIDKILGPDAHLAKLNIVLLASEERLHKSEELINEIRKKTGQIPGAEQLSFTTTTPFGKAVSVALYSEDNKELENARIALIEEMRNLGKIKNIESTDDKGMKELNLTLNERAHALGLSYSGVMNEVRKAFFGREVQRLQKGIDEVKVWVRYSKQNRRSIQDLENMHITLNGAEHILKDLVNIEESRSIVSINHIDGKRSVTVTGDLINPAVDNPNEISGYLKSQVLPQIFANNPSVKSSQEGQVREQMKTGRSAAKVGPMILILMLAIIVLTFRSFKQMIAVVAMLPFGLVGVGWGHLIHDAQISMFSAFGMIALIGIMVNDALVFVSAFNTNLKSGLSFNSALYKAGLSRFRPIILTSLTTVAGLAPLIFEKSFQAQFLIPMAIAIAYGLVAATFLTLVYLPSILKLLNRGSIFIKWLISGKVLSQEKVEKAVQELEVEALHFNENTNRTKKN